MKFTNKVTKQSMAVLLCTAMILSLSGCSQKADIPNAYKINSGVYGLLNIDADTSDTDLMAAGLCVANENIETENKKIKYVIFVGHIITYISE